MSDIDWFWAGWWLNLLPLVLAVLPVSDIGVGGFVALFVYMVGVCGVVVVSGYRRVSWVGDFVLGVVGSGAVGVAVAGLLSMPLAGVFVSVIRGDLLVGVDRVLWGMGRVMDVLWCFVFLIPVQQVVGGVRRFAEERRGVQGRWWSVVGMVMLFVVVVAGLSTVSLSSPGDTRGPVVRTENVVAGRVVCGVDAIEVLLVNQGDRSVDVSRVAVDVVDRSTQRLLLEYSMQSVDLSASEAVSVVNGTSVSEPGGQAWYRLLVADGLPTGAYDVAVYDVDNRWRVEDSCTVS